ncbi:MAG: carboxylating nicotinate-nucleotide diphosphorylase [Vampirovibrio sp.]|nr:carboxylating nicotinate-nucleotide diphosphorylase [Vampirovibrio sp.]
MIDTQIRLSNTVGLALADTVRMAIHEDLAQGDVTTDYLPELQTPAQAILKTRSACVVSGLDVAQEVFQQVFALYQDTSFTMTRLVENGESVSADTVLAKLDGTQACLLRAERTALNFLQHLSGIATYTRQFVHAVEGARPDSSAPADGVRIAHTRKTTPGLRALEIQAVRHGGGYPHRQNLATAVMLKDNHIQAVGSIAGAIKELRQHIAHTTKIEVEADTLDQVEEALESGADVVLLDNMTPETIRRAVALTNKRAILEASGGLTLENIRQYAETGVDVLSTSQITLGAPAIDIGLDF